MTPRDHSAAASCLFIAAAAGAVGWVWTQPDLLYFAGALIFACFAVWLTEPVGPDYWSRNDHR